MVARLLACLPRKQPESHHSSHTRALCCEFPPQAAKNIRGIGFAETRTPRPPALGSPVLLRTDYTFLPAPSEWLTHRSPAQPAISLALLSPYVPHSRPLLPKAVLRAGTTSPAEQPALPCYLTAAVVIKHEQSCRGACAPGPLAAAHGCKLEQRYAGCRRPSYTQRIGE